MILEDLRLKVLRHKLGTWRLEGLDDSNGLEAEGLKAWSLMDQ